MKILHRAWGAFATGFVKTFMRVVYRPDVEYIDVDALNSESAPLIFISNHTSFMDPLLLLTVLARFNPYTIAAKDWYEKKLFTALMDANNCIPVDRYNLDTSWLRRSTDAIRGGGSILIFPEGHTEKSGKVDPFKSGFLMLALMSKAKIVPVWHGDYAGFRKTKIVIGAPQSLPEGLKMTVRDLEPECDSFRSMVIELGEECGENKVAVAK